MNLLKNFVKKIIICEREEKEIKQRNLKIYYWMEKALLSLGFEKGEQFGTFEYFTLEKGKGDKRIVVIVDVHQGIPANLEIYGQKLKNNVWHSYPSLDQEKKINLMSDLREFDNIIHEIRKKITYVGRWLLQNDSIPQQKKQLQVFSREH